MVDAMAYSVRRTPSSRACPVGWNNSVRYSLGLRYDPTRQWSLRLGTAYDETPVPSDVLRTPRIPDSDRIWTTFGVAFRWTDRVRVDFGADPTKIRVRFGSCGVLGEGDIPPDRGRRGAPPRPCLRLPGSRGATRSPSAFRVTASLAPPHAVCLPH